MEVMPFIVVSAVFIFVVDYRLSRIAKSIDRLSEKLPGPE